MPKGFVPVYISKSDFKDYNLLNYIQGDKIKKNFKFEDSLRNTKIRNAAVVYHEAYLDAYNKAMAAKDWEKAKSVVDEFSKKISSDSSLSSLKSKWDDMLFDIDCTIYLPAYVEMLEQKGSFEKIDSKLKFKIPLDNDLYKDYKFNFTDSEGNGLWSVGSSTFMSKIKKFAGKDYSLSDNSGNPYLYRNPTDAEAKAYNQVRKDAVKLFMDGATKKGVMEKDGSSLLFKIYLGNSTYNYGNGKFTIKDSSGNAYTLNEEDFLSYASEVCGIDYRLNGKYNGSYLYAKANELLQLKCIFAFQNGSLHTNLACNMDGKWMYAAELAESKGEIIIKSFRAKKSVFEKVGLKTKDVIRSVVLIDDSGNESPVDLNKLLRIQAPATLRFTIERGSGKKAQTMIFDVPVEWNGDEVKNLRWVDSE